MPKLNTKESIVKLQDLTKIYCFYTYDSVSIYAWLIENKGFKKLEYTAVSGIFGWGDIADSSDWKHEQSTNSLYKKIIDAIDSIESEGEW